MAKKSNKNVWSRREKESLFSYLRRVLSANWLQVLLALLSLLVAIISLYLVWPHKLTEEEILTKSIEDKIALIEDDLNSYNFALGNDSTGEVSLICNYQNEVERYCLLYKSVSNYNYNKTNDLESEALTNFYQFKNNMTSIFTQILLIRDLVGELLKYAKITNDTDYLIFDLKEYNRLNSLLWEEKYYAEGKDPTKFFENKEYQKGLDVLEEVSKSAIELRLQDCFFTNIVNMNNVIKLRFKKIMSKFDDTHEVSDTL